MVHDDRERPAEWRQAFSVHADPEGPVRAWMVSMLSLVPGLPRKPEPPPEVDLAARGSAADVLRLLDLLVDRQFVLDDADGLARVRVKWDTENPRSPDAYADTLLWAMERAGFTVGSGDAVRIGPPPAGLDRLSIVTVDLPVDGLESLMTVDLGETRVRHVETDTIDVACACAFPIVPVIVTDAAGRRPPPEVPLLVDIVASDPRLAVIRDVASSRARVVEVGDLLHDFAQIIEITDEEVLLDDGTSVSRFEGPRPPDPLAPPKGMVHVTADGYRVRRDLLDPYLDDPRGLGRARPWPDIDGRVDGVRLLDLRDDQLPALLGLVNGDLVHQVGDVQVRGPQDFEAVVRELRTRKELCVKLTRGKGPMQLCYTFEGG